MTTVRIWKRPAIKSGSCVDCHQLCLEERVIARTDVEPRDSGTSFGPWILMHEDCMKARVENAGLKVSP